MFELLALIVVVGVFIVVFKLFGVLLEALFFLLALPFKIIFGIIGGVIGLIALPLIIIPAALALIVPLAIVGLAIGGIVLLVK
ncbi:MAG: hypothetical protein R3C41_22910 [Calditrichia bacterium]|nr:hypothetical protein [Calditrichota bacterium]MCB0267567.1 hypothetical protein [Calditrichota bacterium]MCB0285654.1 hypothetical protein [Calditrichota bacterium]MCB9068888.1 hypothetical protein [Calditrichia bacterium]